MGSAPVSLCHNSSSPMPTDLQYFVSKWNASTLTERSAAQQHFRDLCPLGVLRHV